MKQAAERPVLFGWWGVILAWAAWGMINVLRLGAMPEISWPQAIQYGFPDAFIWAAVTPLLVVASRRFEIRGGRRWRHLAALGLISVAVVIGHSALDALIASSAAGFDQLGAIWKSVFVHLLLYEAHTRFLTCTLVLGFAHYQIYARRLAEQQARATRLAAQLTAAQLTSLRRQLRPHFLFNALNSVAASIDGSPERGRRVVRRLGELLRASLRGDDEQWISLEQELELVRAYLEIEQVRFADRLEIEIDAEPAALGCPVPALLLQPIVENAVNHGIARRIDDGRVTVRARLDDQRLVLQVEDSGAGEAEPRATEPGSGIGLRNTRERLEVLYAGASSLRFISVATGARVDIELPARRDEAA